MMKPALSLVTSHGLSKKSLVNDIPLKQLTPLSFQKSFEKPPVLAAEFAAIQANSTTEQTTKPTFWDWLKQGMPLKKPLPPEVYAKQLAIKKSKPYGQRVKEFWRRRVLFLSLAMGSVGGVLGGFYLVGGETKRLFPPAPSPILYRQEHSKPWGEHVKIYAAVSQNDVAPNSVRGGGVFTSSLIQALESPSHSSLQEAFQSFKSGYGFIVGVHQPVESPEGPNIFVKSETKTRHALLIAGGGLDGSGQDMAAIDVARLKKTLLKHYPGVEITVLDKPSSKLLKQTLKDIQDKAPEEFLFYISSEGAALPDNVLSQGKQNQEGGMQGCFELNHSESIFEYELKAMLNPLRMKVAVVADFCGSGALIQ
ncbi:MAG: hypothetical protein K2X66_11305 [Cyanobacteria bacterium]|nr:hypothetical protein [Cyanobacteriota bacterium]